jgi:hypothetical protein
MGASLSSVWLVIFAWTPAGGVAVDHINFVNFAQVGRPDFNPGVGGRKAGSDRPVASAGFDAGLSSYAFVRCPYDQN